MYCRICGETNGIQYYPSKHNTLCRHCAKDTPRKVSRETFDREYWKSDDHNEGPDSVPESTKREFYSDYLASTHTLPEYIERTTSYAM